ncbi:MAG: hypothetical protein FWD55_04425 [Propionibacteriaceae bacterium]|nr:hypothetical protein [Propionibacteriaceae bacterium]
MIDYDVEAQKSIAAAPMPTPQTLKQRKNIFVQFVRFCAINIKMLRVIAASHHK